MPKTCRKPEEIIDYRITRTGIVVFARTSDV